MSLSSRIYESQVEKDKAAVDELNRGLRLAIKERTEDVERDEQASALPVLVQRGSRPSPD